MSTDKSLNTHNRFSFQFNMANVQFIRVSKVPYHDTDVKH